MQTVKANEDVNNDSNALLENTTKKVGQDYEINEYISKIDEYVKKQGIKDIDIVDISKGLFSQNKLDCGNIFSKFIALFFKEVVVAARGAITIFLIFVIMALISSFEIEKNSDITKIANLACFLVLSTITITSFVEVVNVFKNVVLSLTTLMQVISPFMMGMLVATGAITSIGIIQPMLLFLASFIGLLINYVVIPFLSISVAINVICSVSENIRLSKAAKAFNLAAMWIIGVSLTIFLGVLSLETSLTSSVDSLAVKTTQAAVSNFVPVVGKFFSDSFEAVVGASKVVSNVGGTIGIIGIILVSILPIIKIGSVVIIYFLLSIVIEPIIKDDNINKFINGFLNTYKTIFGILIGVDIIFIISTGIILNLTNAVVK